MVEVAAVAAEFAAVAAAALTATAHATMQAQQGEACSATVATHMQVRRCHAASSIAIGNAGDRPLWRAANRRMLQCLRATAGWFDLHARVAILTDNM